MGYATPAERLQEELAKSKRDSVRKMRIYNAKHIFKTIPQFLTTLRKGQWS